MADENFEPSQRLKTYATSLRKARPDLTYQEAARLVIEAFGELQEGHFTKAITDLAPHPNGEYCPYCILGVDLPLLCRRCAHGKLVTQYPNLRMVCLKHRVWTGFTAAHTDQVTVGKSVLRAERKLRQLISCRRVDTVLIQKSRKLLLGGRQGSNADVEIFPDLVALVQLLTSPGFTSQILAPLQSFRASRKMLETHMLAVLTGPYPGLLEGLWSRYRSVILAIRESIRGGVAELPLWEHDPEVPLECMEAWAQAIGPMESPENYFEVTHQAPTKFSGRWPRLTEEQILHYREAPTYDPVRNGHHTAIAGVAHVVCIRGHRRHVGYPNLITALQRGCCTCGYCTGRTVLSGFNDLATRYPMLAASWHPRLNNKFLPSQVLGGGSIEWWWTCDAGHAYLRPISTVIHGLKCPYCAGRRVWPGFNDMATRRPDLAAEWDENRTADGKHQKCRQLP